MLIAIIIIRTIHLNIQLERVITYIRRTIFFIYSFDIYMKRYWNSFSLFELISFMIHKIHFMNNLYRIFIQPVQKRERN